MNRVPLALTSAPMRVTSTGAQDLRLARDVLQLTELELLLTIWGLEGGSPDVTVAVETGMQRDSDFGWVQLTEFTPATSVGTAEKRNVTGLLHYVRFSITGMRASAATFTLEGLGKVCREAGLRVASYQREVGCGCDQCGKSLGDSQGVPPPGDGTMPFLLVDNPPITSSNKNIHSLDDLKRALWCQVLLGCPLENCCNDPSSPLGLRCVDIQWDPLHCGQCDSFCGANSCIMGECESPCDNDNDCGPAEMCVKEFVDLPFKSGADTSKSGGCVLKLCDSHQDCGEFMEHVEGISLCCDIPGSPTKRCINTGSDSHCGGCGQALDCANSPHPENCINVGCCGHPNNPAGAPKYAYASTAASPLSDSYVDTLNSGFCQCENAISNWHWLTPPPVGPMPDC